MKILYGITKSNMGGAQRYVFDLAQGASKQGHDVVVICGTGGTLVEKLRTENVRVIEIPGFGRDIDMFRDAFRLWFIIKNIWREKPDVLHVNSAKMSGAGIFTGRLLGVRRIVFTGHGWAFNEPRPEWQKILIKFFTWLTIVGAHKTICVSEASRQQVIHWPLIRNKLTVVHNGIAPFEILPRQSTGLTVGTLAELHKIKGLDVLLRAWSRFKPQHDGRLVIYGAGEEKKGLERLSKSLGVDDSVEFKGFVNNARAHLSDLDIFILPSRSENLPYAVLEAGLAGLPVIATRVGGIPEIITDGEDGLLIKRDSAEEIYLGLIRLAKDEPLREKFGTNIKNRVLRDFSLDKMLNATLALY